MVRSQWGSKTETPVKEHARSARVIGSIGGPYADSLQAHDGGTILLCDVGDDQKMNSSDFKSPAVRPYL
jgi:hypothetical protein